MKKNIIVVSEGLSKSFDPLWVCCAGAFVLFRTYN